MRKVDKSDNASHIGGADAPNSADAKFQSVKAMQKEDVRSIDELYTFIDISGGHQLLSHSVHAQFLGITSMNEVWVERFQNRLQTVLWDLYGERCWDCDAAHNTMLDLAQKKRIPFVGLMGPLFRLYYVGVIVQIPGEESFPFVTAFGVAFHMFPGCHSDSHATGVYIPAWFWKVVTRADQACVAVSRHDVTIYADASGHIARDLAAAVDPDKRRVSARCW
jgi:hypothetical protein